MLQKDPLRVDPYRSLYKLYLRMHEYDRAWCMCAALAFLRKADDEEQRFFEDYRPARDDPGEEPPRQRAWVKSLFHKDENLFIGKIFEMLTPAAIVAKTEPAPGAEAAPGARRALQAGPGDEHGDVRQDVRVGGAGARRPDAGALRPQRRAGRARRRCRATPPASVAGQTVLTGFTPQELTFIVGKHLSGYRGEHYIKNLFPTLNELKVILFAGVKIVMNDFAVPGEMAQAVNATAMELVKHMQPVQRDVAPARRAEVDRGRREGRPEALDAGHRDHRDAARGSCSAPTSRSPRRSSPPSRSSRATCRRRRR